MSNVGLGLDFQHLGSYGVSFENLISACESSLSHYSIVAITNSEEAKRFKKMSNGTPLIHHFTGVAPGGIEGVNRRQLAVQSNISSILEAKWCLEDLGIWNIGPYSIPYFAPPVLCAATLERTIQEIKVLQAESALEFLPEVPSCSFVVGDIGLGVFFTKIVDACECNIVLDISHVFSYAIYYDISLKEALMSFPLNAVKEFHVAGGSVHPEHKWRYRDTHSEYIVPAVLELMEFAIPLCCNLKAITYEIGIGLPLELLSLEIGALNAICEKVGFVKGI